MYSWERRGGTLPDRHKEPITQDEVLADLARTRDLLTGAHLDPTKKKEDPEDLTSTTGMLAAPELEETLDTSAYDTWTDAKSDAAESYARGDFVAAAGRFAAAAAMLDPTEDKNGIHAAALQSNRSSALLAAGRPADALLAADACVATAPGTCAIDTHSIPPDPSSPPRTGPIVPNQHSALAASPTAVIFGANANVVLAPPVAGPLAGNTRSMRRVGVSHTAVDVSGDGPEASKPVAPPCIAPTVTDVVTSGDSPRATEPGASTRTNADDTRRHVP